MSARYSLLSSQEGESPPQEQCISTAKRQTSQVSETFIKLRVLYILLSLVLIVNGVMFAQTMAMQLKTISAMTQARDIDKLPRPDPYVGLPRS